MSFSASTRFASEFDRRMTHPLHAFLLAGATCSLAGAFLTDWAYYASHEIQWKNFASWLIMAGLVFGGFALLWALIDLIASRSARGRHGIYFVLLLAAWVLGLVNELLHAKDAWASMPEGLVLSGIAAVLAVAASGFGYTNIRTVRR